MLDDLIELLDRQHAFMQRQDGVRFVLQLRRASKDCVPRLSARGFA